MSHIVARTIFQFGFLSSLSWNVQSTLHTKLRLYVTVRH